MANEPCPPIPDGPGSVVLTTVNHLNPNLFELTLDDERGNRTIVRPTGLHKFFSADRQAWVNTAELRLGEKLRGLDGWLTVIRNDHVPGVHRVYNMTVSGEHVFHVSSLGLLSHNNNPCAQPGGGAKRGPKTDPDAPHNKKIREEAEKLRSAGNTIVSGGGGPEKLLPTPGGHKSGRRLDIGYRTPEGKLKGRQIGRAKADGSPIKREDEALEDLNGPGGVPTDFVPYTP